MPSTKDDTLLLSVPIAASGVASMAQSAMACLDKMIRVLLSPSFGKALPDSTWGVGLQHGSVQANMATWSKAELEIAMGMTQDCSRAHELGKSGLPTSFNETRSEVTISDRTASLQIAS